MALCHSVTLALVVVPAARSLGAAVGAAVAAREGQAPDKVPLISVY